MTASRSETAFGKATWGNPKGYPIIVIHLLFSKEHKLADPIQGTLKSWLLEVLDWDIDVIRIKIGRHGRQAGRNSQRTMQDAR